MRDTPKSSRRQLLAAATVTATAAAPGAPAGAEPREAAEPDDRRDVRLEDTGHIRTYCALARR